ncbi:hypothetical protein AB0G48_00310 [Streptomyces rubiginosohelvolus]|uniref:hypothetical protein n=1 Tax=Streptomyces rubiginosohelvolus TaxID=67362 RepID=UPI0033E58BDE
MIGLSTAGQALCGPCSGVDLTYTCSQCGHSGYRYQAGRCARYVLNERLTYLLVTDGGTIPPDLDAVRQALCAVDRPRSLFSWLDRSKVPSMLVELAATGEPITHERLDALPVTHATHYARELLVTAGVLPLRDEYLERQPVWVERLLDAAPEQHRKIAAPFAHWFLLRRLRQAHHQRGGRRVQGGTESILRSRLRRALELMDWLDRWLDEGTSTRQHVRAFIVWARKHQLVGDLKVPLPGRADPVTFIEDDERVEQLRRCVDDEELPLWVRVAGALILLFGLQGSKVLQLTKDDIVDDGASLALDLIGRRLPHLVRHLRDQAANRWRLDQMADTRTWLIPGQSPARPLRAEYLSLKFRDYGLSGLAGRNTARLALAANLLASVLADLTGTSVDNAVRWTKFAKRDWTEYVAARKRDTQN